MGHPSKTAHTPLQEPENAMTPAQRATIREIARELRRMTDGIELCIEELEDFGQECPGTAADDVRETLSAIDFDLMNATLDSVTDTD